MFYLSILTSKNKKGRRGAQNLLSNPTHKPIILFRAIFLDSISRCL